MKNKPLLLVLGEPNSIFSELLFKIFKKKIIKKLNRPIVIIGSINLLKSQMKSLKYLIKIKECNYNDKSKNKFEKNCLNVIDVKYKFKKTFDKVSSNSKVYIKNCFAIALKLLQKGDVVGLINGPISKKYFLEKKYLGITEYLASKTKIKDPTMLIYNKNFAVCPITTHLPINQVCKKLKKNKIISDVLNINNFYKNYFKIKPNFAILGLNPHCETIDEVGEEKKIIIPAIKYLSNKRISIKGPFSADTFFSKKNLDDYDVAVGMYHDQVLTPMKTIFNFNAINITLGLPFLRVSPDHGINIAMMGKNRSDPQSLISSVNFFKKN